MSHRYTLSVPDMSCGHCRASIEAAITPLGGTPVFDMDARRVTVTGDAPEPQVKAALDYIGFPAESV
ncbi:heavy-metal-associated domain-containing protein [Rhodobacter sp. NTK016B]|uniref:heavy-metal-associated domain-containing protein n=1 Tax=Rhodobacter sp. NTK016B TaxID=2759676 RepID=UPI001A9091C6|nr:heavy-metal-associated domain-containing protein [Rhodobacter sp. NTK016B]MBN8293783.1 heavy-metal-associated domain-containing protein [Rhodobacter sp. NTK016B]